jgi:hypothetical protein
MDAEIRKLINTILENLSETCFDCEFNKDDCSQDTFEQPCKLQEIRQAAEAIKARKDYNK